MSELRRDPILGQWIIVAPERARRPNAFVQPEPIAPEAFDPFAEGHEAHTPPEIMAARPPSSRPNGEGWRLRVVPNKFPVLRVEGGLKKRGAGVYDQMAGVGAHEVFIEGPDHVTSITELPDDDVASLVGLYRARLLDLKRDRRMKYGIIFKNRGASAGASLSHSHSQLIVLPVVPKTVQDEMTGAEAYYGFRDRCPYCDILAQETEDEQRMVMLTGRVAAICPYASRFPFETWILPRAHASHFESCSDEDVEEMAFVLKRVLRKLEVALHDPAYNFVIHTAPFHEPYQEHYHWHLEIIPRVVQIAGFEWGTGFHINPVAPEEAASFLRQV